MRKLLAVLAFGVASVIPAGSLAVPALAGTHPVHYKIYRVYHRGGPLATSNTCAYQVTPHETLMVIHKEIGPGGMQFPYVRATIRLYVCPGYVPKGGLVQAILQGRHTIFGRFTPRGQVSFGDPWKAGWTIRKIITTPCIYLHSWWRIKEPYDFIQYNGKPASGTRYYPNKTGFRLTCQIIG